MTNARRQKTAPTAHRAAPRRAQWAGWALVLMMVPWALATPASAQSLLRDAEIEQYLADYSYPLFEAAGLEPSAVEIYLVGDPSLNAFVTAGLKMFVHTGLITAAENPNQVEGVLAHETGHLAGAHQQRGADAYAKMARPTMLSLALGAAIIAAGGAPEAGFGVIGLGQSIGLGEFLSYNRSQESSADQAAITYLEAVGSSGTGLVQFFEKLSNRQLISARNVDPYLMTHPLPSKRMNRLRQQVAVKEHFEDEVTTEEQLQHDMVRAKIIGFMSHHQTTLRQYPLADRSKPARYARAVAYYRSSQLDKALKEIEGLIELEPDNPFFYELKGQMLFEHGKTAASVSPHRRSVELGPQYALLRINLARALIAAESTENIEEAIGILRIALQQEPENGFGWSEMARGYAVLGEEPYAQYAQAQAMYAWGRYGDAMRFASRAKDGLEPGTPEHLQTLDILAVSKDRARDERRRR